MMMSVSVLLLLILALPVIIKRPVTSM